MGFAAKFWLALRKGDIDLALQHMQAYLAGVPYIEGFKKNWLRLLQQKVSGSLHSISFSLCSMSMYARK